MCSSQEQIQTPHKYIKRYFNALVVIKMQTKLTLTCCLYLPGWQMLK